MLDILYLFTYKWLYPIVFDLPWKTASVGVTRSTIIDEEKVVETLVKKVVVVKGCRVSMLESI